MSRKPPSVDEVLERYAIGTALRMPLGSMVSLLLAPGPCVCEAHCFCDGGPTVAEGVS